MQNDQLNSVLTYCGLSLNLCSSIQSCFLQSFIVPAVDLSSGGTGGIRSFSIQGKASLWKSYLLVALCEACGSPAELQPFRSDHRCKCYAKREGEDGEMQDDFRVWCLCFSCSSSWVSSGFTAGCLKKWFLVNLSLYDWWFPLIVKRGHWCFCLICVYFLLYYCNNDLLS